MHLARGTNWKRIWWLLTFYWNRVTLNRIQVQLIFHWNSIKLKFRIIFLFCSWVSVESNCWTEVIPYLPRFKYLVWMAYNRIASQILHQIRLLLRLFVHILWCSFSNAIRRVKPTKRKKICIKLPFIKKKKLRIKWEKKRKAKYSENIMLYIHLQFEYQWCPNDKHKFMSHKMSHLHTIKLLSI